MRLIDLTGKVFGKWKVLHRIKASRTGDIRWQCECECGLQKPVWGCHLRNQKSTGCHQCANPKGDKHIQWTGVGDISGNYWDSIQRGANGLKGGRKPIEFTVTKTEAWELFEKQGKKCALTNLPLVINYHRKLGPEHTASLDRIDSSKGYIPGNIQWVHKDINMMKKTYSQDYFINMCKLVAESKI
jgi:hypothetical protein